MHSKKNRSRLFKVLLTTGTSVISLLVIIMLLVTQTLSAKASAVLAATTSTGFSAHINFEPAGNTVPSGYLADNGAVYGNRGNGYSYGWNADTSAATRIRNSSSSPDLRYDTLVHMQISPNNNASWQIAVPNGTYTVHLVSGDPGYIDSVYHLNVNNQLVVNGTPTATNHWIEGTATINVTNGIIAVSNGTGSQNDKLNYIDITQQASAATTTTAAPTATPTHAPTATPTHAPTATPTHAPTATPTHAPTATPTTAAPTATPTHAPTATPTTVAPTATATSTALSFSLVSTSISPQTGTPGATFGLNASIKASASSTALVDMEVYSANNTKVFQNYVSAQSFTAGQAQNFSFNWATTSSQATGQYTLVIGVFSNDWATNYIWQGNAGTITINSAATPTSVPPTATPTHAPSATPTSVPPTATPTTAPSNPNGLASLKNTFMLGLGNNPGSLSWMTGSGTPWDLRYAYLVGDVTGSNWAQWNSPAGAYATYYMQDSGNNHYIPVFSYYTLYYSTPGNAQSTDSTKDLTNIKTASTMNAYFANFKLLLDQARQYGKPVIIHVEPDFWGFAQQAATNDDPTSVYAAVKSSGYGDVVGNLPDNIAGFAQALVALRNKYAPNVILAYHVSAWATGTDISTNTDPNLNVTNIINRTVNFYKGLNAKFDLLFFDPSDRDAGYYATFDNSSWKHWWDLNNQTFPNFDRFRTFLAGVTSATNTKAMLWQVPIGNTVFDTENNTNHHWQDNRVQYFLGPNYQQHLQAWMNAGLIGIMFGGGDGNQSSNEDGAGDGVTNPSAINGNTQVSTVSDDDGGYLRQQGAQYYKNGALSLP